MTNQFIQLKARGAEYLISLLILLALAALGYGAAHTMDSHGHYISGMNNQVVWGLPHIFAILLILGASGSLNIASLSSVFGKSVYKPWARFSALLAAVLLMGGLLVLVLDLGRPERLIIAMTHFNFASVFAWNVFLYSGFLAVIVLYLVVMFTPGAHLASRRAGALAFGWRFILTSGTGAIFGFLVARQFYDAAILIPLFIVLSLIVGCAAFLLVASVVCRWSGSRMEPEVVAGLSRLMGFFLLAELLLVAAFHLTNLYTAEHQGIERFILSGGGHYTALFWVGQIAVGSLTPILIVFLTNRATNLRGAVTVAALALGGAVCHLYVTIIGGQVYPLVLFPGKTVTSSFHDGVVATYVPSGHELALGMGGVSIALVILIAAIRVLPFLPASSNEVPAR